MQYLKENYLSLSRPQDVRTELILSGEAKFEGELSANNIRLAGLLMETSRYEMYQVFRIAHYKQ